MAYWEKFHPLVPLFPSDRVRLFFNDVPDNGSLLQLFDHIPKVAVFLKDRESRLIYGNQFLLDQLQLKNLSELEGTMDREYFPGEICESFIKDDQWVFSEKSPLIDRVELGFAGSSSLDWYITTKIPIFDTRGNVKGLIGTTRACDNPHLIPGAAPEEPFDQLINWLQQNQDRRITTGEMAQKAGISIKTLRKRFQQLFGVTPQEYELMARIKAASRRLTESDQSIAEIAFEFGFCDQSAFSNQFKKRIGLTPNEFRNRKR